MNVCSVKSVSDAEHVFVPLNLTVGCKPSATGVTGVTVTAVL